MPKKPKPLQVALKKIPNETALDYVPDSYELMLEEKALDFIGTIVRRFTSPTFFEGWNSDPGIRIREIGKQIASAMVNGESSYAGEYAWELNQDLSILSREELWRILGYANVIASGYDGEKKTHQLNLYYILRAVDYAGRLWRQQCEVLAMQSSEIRKATNVQNARNATKSQIVKALKKKVLKLLAESEQLERTSLEKALHLVLPKLEILRDIDNYAIEEGYDFKRSIKRWIRTDPEFCRSFHELLSLSE